MASSAQSLRYGGPASAGPSGTSSDALSRILTDLCTRGNPKVKFFFFLFFHSLLLGE